MKYTVVWNPAAERALTEIWTDADDRPAVTAAADAIDTLLAVDPLDVGESRAGNVRILLAHPLAVYYDVLAVDRLVKVWSVWRVQRK